MNFRLRLASAAAICAVGIVPAYAESQATAEHPLTPPPAYEKQAPEVEKNLKVFDTLDFDVFSNQK